MQYSLICLLMSRAREIERGAKILIPRVIYDLYTIYIYIWTTEISLLLLIMSISSVLIDGVN